MPAAAQPLPLAACAAVRAPAKTALADGLSPGQLRTVVGAIALLHIAGAWALMQVAPVRELVVSAEPIFVSFVSPPTAAPTPPAPTPSPPRAETPPPRLTPAAPLVTAAPTPAPAPFVAEPPPPPLPTPAPAAPAVAESPPTPPAPPPAPKTIPASAVQYLVQPELDYPRTSKRLGETGRVMVRVYVDEAGAVREVQLHKSSGFSRLDDEAVRAVKRARFKPYLENGRPTPGWAFIPLTFELEN